MNDIKSFSGPTQLLFSSLQGRHAGRPLFALPQESGVPILFENQFSSMDFLYHDYAVYRVDGDIGESNRRENVALRFAAEWKGEKGIHDLACIYLPKSTELIEYVFSTVSTTLERGASVLIVGPKKSAIRSCGPLVEKYFGEIMSSRSGRHCVLIEARKTISVPTFQAEKGFPVKACGHELHVVTLPGVFSHGELDGGTALLLDLLEDVKFERALDWGCGAGVIGAALKLSQPKKGVDFVDTNIMAIEATRRTLEKNGLKSERVWPSDIFSDVSDTYDLIVSNPPFHAEIKADFSATHRFIKEARDYLDNSGRLVIVTNAFINYFRTLRRSFKNLRVIAENRKYRVIEACDAIQD